MKCVDCGKEFKPTPSKKELRVTLSNPGNISAEGTIFECPHCLQHYTNEKEMVHMMQAFEKARLQKQH